MSIFFYDKAIAGDVSTHPRISTMSRRASVEMLSAHLNCGSNDENVMNETHAQSRHPSDKLAGICRACEGLLRTAAEVAESGELRRQFLRRAMNWARLETELLNAAPIPDDVDGYAANAAGTLQRAWIKIKSALGDMNAIAAECAQREAEALQELRAAIDADLPDSIRDPIRRFVYKETRVK